MLPEELTLHDPREYRNDENWKIYLNRIGNFKNSIPLEFLSQICYEHSRRFNFQFPKFDINKNKIIKVYMTPIDILNNIKYEHNEKLNFHNDIINNYFENPSNEIKHPVLKFILENKTWSFPPVIIKYSLAKKLGCKIAGKPIYLFEGTHRICYILRLFELNEISKESKHEFLEII